MGDAIRVSETLELPLDWMMLSTIVFGVPGAGKSTFGRKVAEEVARIGYRFCAIDGKGDWYGLKSSADGKKDGLPVVVFGGEHADLPLDPGSGASLARTIAQRGHSCILDYELLTTATRTTLLADFFETLFQVNREPLVLLCDELQDYGPQVPVAGKRNPDAIRCLYAIIEIAKKGRKHGLGRVFFTQRGAAANKDISEICDMLVSFRAPGTLDQERAKSWLGASYGKQQSEEAMSKMSELPDGSALFASRHPKAPAFGIHSVSMPWTFDSSRTPELGQKPATPARLAAPDLAELRSAMAADIVREEESDPARLRARIAELEAERASKPKSAPAPSPPPPLGPVLEPHEIAVHREHLEQIVDGSQGLEEGLDWLVKAMHGIATLASSMQNASTTGSRSLEKQLKKAEASTLGTDDMIGAVGKLRERPLPSMPDLTGSVPGLVWHHEDGEPERRDTLLSPGPSSERPKGWTDMEEDLYQRVKARLIAELREEAPVILRMLATAPELEVTVERQVVQVDGKTLRGRMARLVAEGFFGEPRNANQAWKELNRTGDGAAVRSVYKEADNLVGLGILTKEKDGYQEAPGAKVSLRKAG